MKKIMPLFILSFLLFAVSCNNSKKATENNNSSQKTTDKEVSHPEKSLVDYYAQGDSWELSVQYEHGITFTDKERNIKFSSKETKKSIAQGVNIVVLQAKDENYTINVNIDVVECNRNGRKVNILLQQKEGKNKYDYSGCGEYLGAPRLHDIWVVEKIDGEEINPREFPNEGPHFEFNLVENTISGFAGCNRVNGQLRFDYNKIIFDGLLSTKMYCGDASKIENQILKIFHSNPIYNFVDTKLYIETTEGSIIFKKID